MNITELKNALKEIENINLLKDICKCGPLQSYDIKKQWFSDYFPGGKNNGIYIYSTRRGEILYIGKAEQKNEGGISYRVCSHLGRVTKKSDNIFNEHQWMEDSDLRITDEIKTTIRKGDFILWTYPVEPSYLVSFFEVYFQTLCIKISGELPPLNKKIG